MRSVSGQRMTVPLKSGGRQFRRRTVSGKFSSGHRLNRPATVIMLYGGELSALFIPMSIFLL